MSIHWPALIDKIPSPVVETVSGLCCVGLAAVGLLLALHHPKLALFVVANGFSFLYEMKLDANGFSWSDIGEREVGILLGLALASLIVH